MKILVTGGAGYIGSHTIVELLNNDHEVIVIDNLSNSSIESVKRTEKLVGKKIDFYGIDLCNPKETERAFQENEIDAVIHFAALKAVGESIKKPLDYYRNNIDSTLVLLDKCNKYSVSKIIFSSSASVYGVNALAPITELDKVGDGISNPYGKTKYFIENILIDFQEVNTNLSVAILRYFNPVGAHESGEIGEDPGGTPSNILPYISLVAAGKLDKVNVFGDDYNTLDGTGIRDYIHVVDLAKGHVSALNALKPGVSIYNLGTGKGTSVIELIDAFSKACGKKIPYVIAPRRDGDIAMSYASVDKANKELGWFAERTIEDACRDAWRWQHQNPDGYQTPSFKK